MYQLEVTTHPDRSDYVALPGHATDDKAQAAEWLRTWGKAGFAARVVRHGTIDRVIAYSPQEVTDAQ